VHLAAAVMLVSRVAIGSMISTISSLTLAKGLEPIAIIRYMSYDETPLKAGVVQSDKKRGAKKRKVQRSLRTTEQAKIENVELRVAFLVRDLERDVTMFVHTEVPCQLLSADRTTGEVARKILEMSGRIPMLEEAVTSDVFPIIIEATTRDQASGNLRAEASLANDMVRRWFLGQPCVIHCVHTITGRVLKPVSDTVSGAIALGVTQKSTGASAKFRAAIATVLKNNVVVAKGGCPPGDDSPWLVHRKALLDAWQEGRKDLSLKRRRVVFEKLFKDDWTQNAFRLCVGENDDDATIKATVENWAVEAAEALAPCPVKVFPRHRWCTSAATSGELLLLTFCHDLLRQVVPLWLESMGHKANKSLWDELGEIVLEGLEGEAYWSAFYEKQRGDSLRMSQAVSTPACAALWHMCMQPCIRLMNTLLRYGSEQWGECETQDVVLGLPRAYRVLDAAVGKITAKADAMLFSLVSKSSSWAFLPNSLQTYRVRSLAWAMLARTGAGIQMQVIARFEGYPYRLWLLIDPQTPLDRAANLIANDAECLWCSFTVQFRSRFRTVEQLKVESAETC
jgi:hypothetical protein